MIALDAEFATAPSACTERRHEALALHLDQLRDAARNGEDLSNAFDGIDLDYWELNQLQKALSDAEYPWQALIAEGVALRTKFTTDIGWAANAGNLRGAEAVEVRNMMINDAALAIALLEETQRAVNQLVLSGAIDEAKKLTGFRNKVGQGLNDLKGRVGDAGYAEAKLLSEDLIEPINRASWTTMATRSVAVMQTKPAHHDPVVHITYSKSDAPQQSDAPQRHLKPLLMVLGAAVCLWAALIVPGLPSNDLPVLKMKDLTQRAEVRRIVARPPSLFIEVDHAGWNALDRDSQLELIDEIGHTANASGYFGARFTSADGETVGQWFKERGGELIDD